MQEITEKVSAFRGILLTMWNWFDFQKEETPQIISWIRANWEILLERELLSGECILPPLYYEVHEENKKFEKSPSHQILVSTHDSKNKDQALWIFNGFKSSIDHHKLIAPPFDIAELRLDSCVDFKPFDTLKFFLSKSQ